jgi:hypothetical protein
MVKLAYILAASHSGSTLLSMLLGSHQQIATVGELKLSTKAIGDIDRYRCSCGQFIRRCDFWQKIAAGMAGQGYDFDIADAGTDYRAVESLYARRLLSSMVRGKLLEHCRDAALSVSAVWRKQLPQIHKRNAALVSTIAELSKAQVVVDSSKIGLRLKYLLKNPELDVKVIRLIRDGRAVALTYMNPADFADARDPALRAGGTGGDRSNERMSMEKAAYQWRRCMEEAKHVLKRLDKSQWIEVRYEDLCRDTETVLERLFNFLGLETGNKAKDFRSVEQHVIGNGMRLDNTAQVVLDERWRTVLTKGDLRTFDHIAGETNRLYGYE